MAKRNSSGGGFGRFFAILLALIIGAGVVTGIVYREHVGVIWNKAMNFLGRVDDEVKQNEANKDDDKDDETNTGTSTESEKHDNMLVSDVENKGLTLAMTPLLASELSPQAESGLTLTATVSPAEATDKTLDWTVEWADSSNAWAQGKKATDYVTITPTSDGSNVATVECLKDFGAQLIVKSTSRSNPNAYATCTLDYYARITGATVEITNESGAKTDFTMGEVSKEQISLGMPCLASISSGGNNAIITDDICGKSGIEIIYTTSNYTIPLNVEEASISENFYYDGGFAEYLQNNNFNVASTSFVTFNLDSLPEEFDIKYFGAYISYKLSNTVVIPGLPQQTFEDYLATNGARYLSLVNAYTSPAYVIILNYADEMNDVTFALSLSYQANYFNIAVENVEMNNTGAVL